MYNKLLITIQQTQYNIKSLTTSETGNYINP